MLMDKIDNESWRKKVLNKSILNYAIHRYKKDGFVVECELKQKGSFKYFELRRFDKKDSKVTEKIFYDRYGNNVLSSQTINNYNLYNN